MSYQFGILMYLILLGILGSQCIVVHFTQNEMRLKNMEKTIQSTWSAIHRSIPTVPTEPHLDRSKIEHSMKNYRTFLTQAFLLFHVVWIMIITMYIPPFMKTEKSLIIFLCYWALLVLVSFMTYFIMMAYFKEQASNYVYVGFFYRD